MASFDSYNQFHKLAQAAESDQEDQYQEDQVQEDQVQEDQDQEDQDQDQPQEYIKNKLSYIRFKPRSSYDRPSPYKLKRDRGNGKVIILKNVGSIGIFTHGLLDKHAIVSCPRNVVVNKYSIASENCSVISVVLLQDDPYCYAVTEEALFNFNDMFDISEYKKFAVGIKDKSNQPKMSSNLNLNIKKLKRKSYFTINETIPDSDINFSPSIIFTVALAGRTNKDKSQIYKRINLILCDVEELKNFFKITPTSLLTNETAIEKFIVDRDILNKITTDQLMELISIADYNLNLGHVNILDLSCSVREAVVPSLRTDEYGYRHTKINRDPDFDYPSKVISGGRKTRKRKRKT